MGGVDRNEDEERHGTPRGRGRLLVPKFGSNRRMCHASRSGRDGTKRNRRRGERRHRENEGEPKGAPERRCRGTEETGKVEVGTLGPPTSRVQKSETSEGTTSWGT